MLCGADLHDYRTTAQSSSPIKALINGNMYSTVSDSRVVEWSSKINGN